MTIRLNKVTRDLNVGISTIVEFLQKKGFTVEANPNTRISEEQYALLTKEFSSDKDLRLKSEMLTRDSRNNRRESAVEEVRTETTSREVFKQKPAAAQTTPVQPAAPKEEPKPATVAATSTTTAAAQQPTTPKASETSPTTVVEKPAAVEQPKEEQPMQQQRSQTSTAEQKPSQPQAQQPAVQTAEKPQQAAQAPQVATPAPSQPTAAMQPQAEAAPKEAAKESAPVAPKPATDSKSSVEEKPAEPVQKEEAQEETIFKISRTEPVSKINVIGRIDLAALNQSTRPKKKSKEERKKEREEKERQRMDQRKQMKEAIMKEIRRDDSSAKGDSSSSESKKKRARINKDRVDIEEMRSSGSNRGDRRNERGERGDRNERKEQGKRNKDRNKQQQQPIVREVNEEDVARQVKETLARLTSKGAKSKASKYRKEKREMAAERNEELEKREMAESKVLKITEFVTANELASMMDISVTQVIATCMSVGIMVSINQRLDAETINLVAEEFGFKTEYVSAEVAQAIVEEEDAEEDLEPRAPIVTVMGHVDHGKTSLLDYIRKANVIAGEAGGITQHIGAYHVTLEDGRVITFLDTPGHEAFTAMRARGAKVTDIAIIIVAADDNVMPQTKEAINHAMAAGVPIVFAINKIDKPAANPDKIKEELANMNFLVEDWGGKYQSQDISAKKGIGVNELMEKVLLEAEMLELKANPHRKATGSIIESSLDKGRGYVATVLVSNGTLRVGDIVLAGTHYGRVKAMFNERNQRMTEAGPATPALILGLNGAPAAGDTFHVIDTDQEAREIANKREQLQREQGLRTQKMLTLDEVGRRLALGDFHELNIIVKGDVDGSVEALSDSLIKLSTEQIQVNVIHKGVGQISESDVSLAAASGAIIVGFQVRPSGAAAKLAEQEGVDIRKYSVIYDAIEEVKAAMEGMLAPTLKEQVTATIEVREVFNISKVGLVAGAMVRTGKVKRTDKARLIRDGIVVFTGSINALKRFKDDVKEVGTNFECGISLTACNDIKVGDVIETYEEIEVKATL
ncbi:MAG: translation initiation factor IF-2 [Mediterranea sp.]|nr:translation initiation factor IF-2 [Mediterranea sp.]